MAKAKKSPTPEIEETESTLSPKQRAYELLKQEINKQCGELALVQPEDTDLEDFAGQSIGSGCLSLDLALAHPYPRGRITEILGPEANGKTTLCLHAAAEAQRRYPDERVGIVDVEHALDTSYAKRCGVNLNKLDVSHPDSGEQALDITDKLIRSGLYSLVIVDSVAALAPQDELAGEMGKQFMGLHARLMSKAMRKLVGPISKSNTAVIFVNQIRMKIGVMFGNPETTTGGNALKYYATQRLDVRRTGYLKEGTKDDANVYGITTRVKVIKNKVAPPFKEIEFDIVFGKGIDATSDLLTKATEVGVVALGGTWYSYMDDRLGQGRANAIETLKKNPKLIEDIRAKVMKVFSVPALPAVVASNETSEAEVELAVA